MVRNYNGQKLQWSKIIMVKNNNGKKSEKTVYTDLNIGQQYWSMKKNKTRTFVAMKKGSIRWFIIMVKNNHGQK